MKKYSVIERYESSNKIVVSGLPSVEAAHQWVVREDPSGRRRLIVMAEKEEEPNERTTR